MKDILMDTTKYKEKERERDRAETDRQQPDTCTTIQQPGKHRGRETERQNHKQR